MFETIIDINAAASTNDTPTISKILYDRKSAAFALSLSTRSLDYATGNGLIDHVKQGSKIMFLHSALVKFARTNHAALCSVDE